MYQRYYRQRKFGRIFSFFLVVGSGLHHYVKASFKGAKSLFKLETIKSYECYLPSEVSQITRYISRNFDGIGKRSYMNIKNDVYLYQSNLKRSVELNTKERVYKPIKPKLFEDIQITRRFFFWWKVK